MIITFVGHSLVPSGNQIKEEVKNKLRDIIPKEAPVTFYLGGYGNFDKICACACRELKIEYKGLELVYVTPYISLSEQEKIKEMLKLKSYDSSIYPPIESTPPKFAIVKRNRWMIENADLIVAFVNHSYGGAYNSLQIAKRKKKTIINLCDQV